MRHSTLFLLVTSLNAVLCASNGREVQQDEWISLQKRAPLPDPAGGDIIEPSDHMGLVKKAAHSATKASSSDHTSSSWADQLNVGALKWLQRAQASVYRDANLIREIREYHAKKRMKSASGEDYLRQKHKDKIWEDYMTTPRDATLEVLVDGIQDRYMQDWGYYRALGFEQQRLLGPDGVSEETYNSMNNAFRGWSLCNDATAIEASRMAKKELLAFQSIADDPTWSEMKKIDLATKAIAWAKKYRLLLQQEATRGIKRRRDDQE